MFLHYQRNRIKIEKISNLIDVAIIPSNLILSGNFLGNEDFLGKDLAVSALAKWFPNLHFQLSLLSN